MYNVYQDMCTYSQLKKKLTKKLCNPPRESIPPLMFQNCTRLVEKISQNVLKVEA